MAETRLWALLAFCVESDPGEMPCSPPLEEADLAEAIERALLLDPAAANRPTVF
jgi:hypothetical protein